MDRACWAPRRKPAKWLLLAALGTGVPAAQAATLVVTSTADTAGVTCTATCTLRQAITAANLTVVADTIKFAIPTPVKGELLIQPASPLPTITQPLIIDGYSQSGTAVNTDPVASNARLRVRIDGTAAGATSSAFAVCANNTQIRGVSITGFSQINQRAVRFGHDAAGSPCATSPTGGALRGSFIGLRSDGTTAGPNRAIQISGAVVIVGGSTVADRNLIASSLSDGLSLLGGAVAGSAVLNNLIGTDRSATLDRGNNSGVSIGNAAADILIGNAAAPNLIAFSNFAGISTNAASGSGNTWFANRLQSNAFGIDLASDGVTANDANDADSGPNGRQNFPVITAASRTGSQVQIDATLDVGGIAANLQTFTIAAYASAACNASGHGEGERFLGSVNRALFNLPAGEAFSLTLDTGDPLPPGSTVTLTATSANGSTSEFSACFELDPPPIVVNSSADPGDGVCNASECTLREAIATANGRAADVLSVIDFAIPTPANGEILIQPGTPLPTIERAMLIDGYSQTGTAPNTVANGSNAVLRLRIDGAASGSLASAFGVCADQVEIRGFAITNYPGVNQRAVRFGRTTIGEACASAPQQGVFAGNFVGLLTDGSSAAPVRGVSVSSGQVRIGGPTVSDRNIISSGLSDGIILTGAAQAEILNNLIGTDRTGQGDRGNFGNGIVLSVDGARIGSPGAPNLIAFNGNSGIETNPVPVVGNTWYANVIRDNDGPGIDLANDDVTPNDPDDADTGANGLQNFPELSVAQRSSAGLRVAGTLDVPVGTSNATYVIGIYANSACDPSGFGEGERYLGQVEVVLSQGTKESFNVEIATDDPLGPGTQVTSTATAPDGSTSEFSACIEATDPPPGFTVTSTADSAGTVCGAACTLRQAINAANLQPGADLISFAIPGTGPFVISPASELPAITEALTIDGYTQLGASPNTAALGSNAVILIQLDGGDTVANGLQSCADPVVLRGLSLTNFTISAIRTRSDGAGGCALDGAVVVVEGNFIGLDPAGNGSDFTGTGVSVTDSAARIGGASVAARNVIGALQRGIDLRLDCTGTIVSNNLLGVAPDGSSPRPIGIAGNFDQSATGISFGVPEAPNLIRSNLVGLLLRPTTSGNRLFANEFADTSGLAIDLMAVGNVSGPTPNDPDDADSGGNDLQNFPVLGSGLAFDDSLTINGVLDVPATASNAPYTIALYESAACDASGNGEGEIFLGAQVVNLSGSAETFSVTLPVTAPAPGRVITATATDPNGNTSEFSACLSAPVILTIFADGFEG